jgi:plastocyanin
MRITIICIPAINFMGFKLKNTLRFICFVFATSVGTGISTAHAADDETFTLSIKNHKFEPAELSVPSGKRIKLIVKNEDPTPEEFESKDLKREKVIGGGKQATIVVGPLKPGSYKFFGEYNESTAKGQLIAK